MLQATDMMEESEHMNQQHQDKLDKHNVTLDTITALAEEAGVDVTKALMPAKVAMLQAERAHENGSDDVSTLIAELDAATKTAEGAVRKEIQAYKVHKKMVGEYGDRVERLSERLQNAVAQLEASNINTATLQDQRADASEQVNELISHVRRGPVDAEMEDWGR